MNVKFLTVTLSLLAVPTVSSAVDQVPTVSQAVRDAQRAAAKNITVSSAGATNPVAVANQQLLEEFLKAFEDKSLSSKMRDGDGGTTCFATGGT